MKRGIALFAFLLVMVGSVFGQTDHGYNLYGQFLGTSTRSGFGFDSRFKSGGTLGYSIGLAYTDILSSSATCIAIKGVFRRFILNEYSLHYE